MKKVLKRVGIVVLVLYLVVTTVLLAGYMIESSVEESNKNKSSSYNTASTIPLTKTEISTDDISMDILLSRTNDNRRLNGKSAVILDPKLNQAALDKCNDMVQRDYWSHNTPDGKEPFTFITRLGVDYQKAGENIAFGQFSAEETIQDWMESPTHKATMLNGYYTNVGFGVCESANYVGKGNQLVIVQHFIQK